MFNFNSIKAVLFDLDGVLYIGQQPIDGAIEAVAKIRKAGIAVRFVTNTSTLSLLALQKKTQRSRLQCSAGRNHECTTSDHSIPEKTA